MKKLMIIATLFCALLCTKASAQVSFDLHVGSRYDYYDVDDRPQRTIIIVSVDNRRDIVRYRYVDDRRIYVRNYGQFKKHCRKYEDNRHYRNHREEEHGDRHHGHGRGHGKH